MDQILTSAEFSKNFSTTAELETPTEYISAMLIEFAKLHVESALKAKVKAMTEKSYEDSSYSMNELDSFTRNSYPLEKIK